VAAGTLRDRGKIAEAWIAGLDRERTPDNDGSHPRGPATFLSLESVPLFFGSGTSMERINGDVEGPTTAGRDKQTVSTIVVAIVLLTFEPFRSIIE